jgi:alpha-galactosidase
MLSKTPPMGWNTWNTFAGDISESLIKETTDAMIEYGLRDAGYQYVVIDDCWSEKQRGTGGELLPDAAKFPSGMKNLGEYIHDRSMKFGMYSCVGIRTCADFPGSLGHEYLDADTFASWGVDFLKYDYCYKPKHLDGHLLYKRMAMALRSCGRDILFSACSWGRDQPENFMRSAGADIWRSTDDIEDNWESIKEIALRQIGLLPYGAPGCYVDMDMLVVGIHGKGNMGRGGCTDEEYRTHFSLWCMFNSPLMIGCDVRKLDNVSRQILTNSMMISINQDAEGRAPWVVDAGNERLVCIRPLVNGEYAIGLFNLSDQKANLSLCFWDIGLPIETGFSMKLYDVWRDVDAGIAKEGLQAMLDPHSCVVFKATLHKG